MWHILTHPLCRERRLAALWRYLSWQAGSRLLAAPVAIPIVNGARLLAVRGMTGATGNVYTGLHEFEDMAFVLHALEPGDVFADVGANIGSYTLLAAAGVGARVVAFEPDQGASMWLRRNVGLNCVENRVRVVEAAVGETPGTVRFTTGLDTVNHVVDVDGKAGSSTDIMVVRLDDELGDQVPRVMKLDVEGYELPVLRGGAQLLVDTRLEAIVVELNGSGQRYGFHDSDTVALLEGAGFERCVYDPFSRELSPRRVDHRNDNVLFIRAGSDVGARMKSAAPFTVLGRTI